jgi:delta 1-pyrroline-5-carboxylate dehydrogenase
VEILPRLEASVAAIKVGAATDPTVMIGPMVSQKQYDRVRGYIRLGLDEGAKLVGGEGRPEGLSRGWFVRPTVFTGVSNDMRIAREKIFGPVLCVIPYEDEAEAITIANDTTYELQAYVASADPAHARRVAEQLESGRVVINGAPHEPPAPFGGFRQSGIGREYGRFSLDKDLEAGRSSSEFGRARRSRRLARRAWSRSPLCNWALVSAALSARHIPTDLKEGMGGMCYARWMAQDHFRGLATTRHRWRLPATLQLVDLTISQAAKADLREVWNAPDRATAATAITPFVDKYGAKYEKAVTCLLKDRDSLLTFYDFPAEHWDRRRTSNPIESVFATVRHRIVRTKGALSQETAKLMVFKLITAAAKTWRRLKSENQLPKLVQGVTFTNGVEIIKTPDQNAA